MTAGLECRLTLMLSLFLNQQPFLPAIQLWIQFLKTLKKPVVLLQGEKLHLFDSVTWKIFENFLSFTAPNQTFALSSNAVHQGLLKNNGVFSY